MPYFWRVTLPRKYELEALIVSRYALAVARPLLGGTIAAKNGHLFPFNWDKMEMVGTGPPRFVQPKDEKHIGFSPKHYGNHARERRMFGATLLYGPYHTICRKVRGSTKFGTCNAP